MHTFLPSKTLGARVSLAALSAQLVLGSLALGLTPTTALAAPPPKCNGINATIIGTNAANTIHLTAGDDVVYADDGDDTILNTVPGGNDTICGGKGNDAITTGDGNDYIDGEDDDDTINAGNGTNTLKGGKGNDIITTGSGNDTIDGEDGNDTIDAGEGDNTVKGGKQNDTITTGSGNDTIDGEDGNDTIDAGEGDNTVKGGKQNDTITTGSGNDIVNGEENTDTCTPGTGSNTVTNCETIINLPGTLRVTKVTIGGDGSFDFTGAAAFSIATTAGMGTYDITGLAPGSYSVTEMVPVGWDKTGDTCQNVVVTSGNISTCTVTNTKYGTLTVVKNTIGGDGTFDFTGDEPIGDFSLTTVAGSASVSYPVSTLSTYSVTEDEVEGWQENENDCSDVVITAGVTSTCTIENQKISSIEVRKKSIDGVGVFHFTGLDEGFNLTTIEEESYVSYFFSIFTDPEGDSFTISEDAQPGWNLTDSSCVYNEESIGSEPTPGTHELTLDPGDSIVCSYENTKSVCGNGLVQNGELCDDGNLTTGEGCSDTCSIEIGYSCTGSEPSVCSPHCGNGLPDEGEECDLGTGEDGNSNYGACTLTCENAVCGDGFEQSSNEEQCDDGNLENGDGCSASCLEEYCGDSIVNNGEECDGGEGCSESCTYEEEAVPSCDGQTATIWVNSHNVIVGGPDDGDAYDAGYTKLNGTNGNDVIVGTNLKDKVDGKDGNDVICGLDDNDDLKGGKGDDTIFGGEGKDKLDGGDGGDELHGEAGDDDLKGGKNNDILCGGVSKDKLKGGDGDDRLDGGTEKDDLKGDKNSDLCVQGEKVGSCESTEGTVPECDDEGGSSSSSSSSSEDNACVPSDQGLIAYWTFDEDEEEDGAIAYDNSQNTNDATLMNDVVRSSDSAPVSFDNVYSTQYSAEGNQYFTAPDSESLDLSTSATVSYWFKRPLGGQVSVSKWDAGTNQRSFVLQVFTDGKIYWNVSGDGVAHTYLMSDVTVSDTGWNHLAATFDGVSMKLYLNGSLMTGTLVGTIPVSIYQSNQPVTNTYSGSNFNEGSLDDVRLYDVALSASQIASLADGMCSVDTEGSSSSSSSSTSSSSSSSSSVSSGGGDEGGGGGEVFGLSTPGIRGRNGARRGAQTNILKSLIDLFGGDGEAGGVPPGGSGGPGEEEFTAEETVVICRLRKALPLSDKSAPSAAHKWVALQLTEKMSHSYDAILAELRSGSICPQEVVRSTVETKPVSFRVDAAGYPVSSNETWNKCFRGTATLEDIRNNPDRDQDGYGYSCSRYHTSSLWRHPDLDVLFTWNSAKKSVNLPVGYALRQDATVTQR